MKNTKGNYTFKGRYTLREMNGTWFIYDREKITITGRLNSATFVGAEKELLQFKKEQGDD